MPSSSLRTAQTAIVDALLQRPGMVYSEIAAACATGPGVPAGDLLGALQALRDNGSIHGFHAGTATLWVLRPAPLRRPEYCTYCEEHLAEPGLAGLCGVCSDECPDGCGQPVAGCACCDDYEPLDPI